MHTPLQGERTGIEASQWRSLFFFLIFDYTDMAFYTMSQHSSIDIDIDIDNISCWRKSGHGPGVWEWSRYHGMHEPSIQGRRFVYFSFIFHLSSSIFHNDLGKKS